MPGGEAELGRLLATYLDGGRLSGPFAALRRQTAQTPPTCAPSYWRIAATSRRSAHVCRRSPKIVLAATG